VQHDPKRPQIFFSYLTPKWHAPSKDFSIRDSHSIHKPNTFIDRQHFQTGLTYRVLPESTPSSSTSTDYSTLMIINSDLNIPTETIHLLVYLYYFMLFTRRDYAKTGNLYDKLMFDGYDFPSTHDVHYPCFNQELRGKHCSPHKISNFPRNKSSCSLWQQNQTALVSSRKTVSISPTGPLQSDLCWRWSID